MSIVSRRLSLVDEANGLADAGEHSRAVSLYKLAIAAGDGWAMLNLGNSLAALGRWPEARDAFLEATRRGDDEAWFNLGQALEAMADEAGAANAFREATRHGDPKGHLGLALHRRRHGETESSRASLQEALREEPTRPLAQAISSVWDWEDTRDPSLEAALRDAIPAYGSAAVALADLLTSTSRAADAQRVLEDGCRSGDPDCCLPLGLRYESLGELDRAADAYRKGIRNGDKNCYLNLGQVLMELGRVSEGIDALRMGAKHGDELAVRALRKAKRSTDPS